MAEIVRHGDMQLDKKETPCQFQPPPPPDSNGPLSNAQFPLIQRRRDAFRLVKIHEFNGHEFVAKFFSQFTFCSFCDEFLWYNLKFIFYFATCSDRL